MSKKPSRTFGKVFYVNNYKNFKITYNKLRLNKKKGDFIMFNFFRKKNSITLDEAKDILEDLDLNFSEINDEKIKVKTLYRRNGKNFNKAYLEKDKEGIYLLDGWGGTMAVLSNKDNFKEELNKYPSIN